ncbi:unnamed protein product [Victoria cruziana]
METAKSWMMPMPQSLERVRTKWPWKVTWLFPAVPETTPCCKTCLLNERSFHLTAFSASPSLFDLPVGVPFQLKRSLQIPQPKQATGECLESNQYGSFGIHTRAVNILI